MFILYTLSAVSLDSRSPALFGVVDTTSTVLHEAQLLEDNTAALEARLQLIERAQNYIVLETFIYSLDLLGEWILQALVNKKKRDPHVHIRILIDSSPFEKTLDAFHAKELEKYGIELRLYNPAGPLELLELNYRNHRKLIASEKEIIVGGRNIANDYFGLADRKNFLDRDILFRGSIQAAVMNSFELFWASHHSQTIKEIPFPNMNDYSQDDVYNYEKAVSNWNTRTLKAQQFRISEFSRYESEMLLQRFRIAGVRSLARQPIFKINNIRFVSDGPTGPRPSETIVGPVMLGNIRLTQTRLIIENGYLIPDEDSWPIYLSLMRSGKELFILTNSRKVAEQEIVVATLTLAHAKNFAYYGGRVFLYSGALMPSHENPIAERTKNTSFATHAKSYVIDGYKCMVGTANFDPRSLRRVNSELAVFIEDRKLCQYLMAMIFERAQGGELMKFDGELASGAKTNEIRSLYERLIFLLLPVIRLFERWL